MKENNDNDFIIKICEKTYYNIIKLIMMMIINENHDSDNIDIKIISMTIIINVG